MRKDVLIESVRKAILKQHGNQDSLKHAHPQVVADEVEKAYDQLMKTFYASNVNLMNAELDYYSKKYVESVKVDDNGVRYVDLPARPVALKNNLGLRYVRAKNGQHSFVRTNDMEIESLCELEIYKYSRKAFFYVDGGRIVFRFPEKEYELIPEVEIKLLPLFSEFDDEDNIEFPTGGKAPTDMVLETLGFRITDNVNDDVR